MSSPTPAFTPSLAPSPLLSLSVDPLEQRCPRPDPLPPRRRHPPPRLTSSPAAGPALFPPHPPPPPSPPPIRREEGSRADRTRASIWTSVCTRGRLRLVLVPPQAGSRSSRTRVVVKSRPRRRREEAFFLRLPSTSACRSPATPTLPRLPTSSRRVELL